MASRPGATNVGEIYAVKGNQEMESIRHKKVIVKHFGAADAMAVVEVETQPPSEGFARLKVLAIGMGYTDIVARRGEYIFERKPTFTPGYELVGEVIDYTEGPKERKPAWLQKGIRVAVCLPRMGAYTECISLPYQRLVPVPDHVDTYSAAAMPLDYLTAFSLLERHAKVARGDCVLIHGASGGVGTAICQLGRLKGLKMYGTASPQHTRRLETYSVHVIDYRQQDFATILQQKEPAGPKAIFDPIGGATLRKSYRLLPKGGILVSYAFMGRPGKVYWDSFTGALQNILWGKLPNSRRTAICSIPLEIKKDIAWYQNSLSRLLGMANEHLLAPGISEIFRLADVRAAQAFLERREKPGKVLLKP